MSTNPHASPFLPFAALFSHLWQLKFEGMSENTDDQASSSKVASANTEPPKKFPKGVVLGKDGKP
jgi:hypothetical protein